MHVADFNADAGVITVRDSKAGKPRHVVLTDEGQRLFGECTAIRSAQPFSAASTWLAMSFIASLAEP